MRCLVFLTWIGLSSLAAADPFSAESKRIDIGGYELNFNIIRGCQCSPVIVFESGGGDDSSVWGAISKAASSQTGATTITYDRAGFGKSQRNPARYDVTEEVKALEQGLSLLNVTEPLVLVAHSYGGFLAMLFAERNPDRVQGLVLVDANLASYFTDARIHRLKKEFAQNRESQNPALLPLLDAFETTVQTMRKGKFPSTIPVIDIVAENPPMKTRAENVAWKQAHEDFVNAAKNRKLVIAVGSGHHVMKDRPELIEAEIVAMTGLVRTAKQ